MLTFEAIAAAGGTVSLMHRLTDDAGIPIQQADIDTIRYTIYAIGSGERLEAVIGHDDNSLDAAGVIFGELQTDPPWDSEEDPVGYNFLHSPDVSENDAFPQWGSNYLVVYKVTPATGLPIVWRWVVRTPPVC
jgi:hypothetical protein